MSLPKKTTVIKKNDKLAGELCRARGACERCGRKGRVEWTHVFGRRSKNLRWDMQNCLALCSTCHRWNHEYPLEYAEWFKSNWPERYDYLKRRYNEVKKMTVHDYLKIQEELKEKLRQLPPGEV